VSLFLDAASVAANLAYMATFTAAYVIELSGRDYRALARSTRWMWRAVALAVLVFLIKVASIPYDGIWWVAVPGLTVASAIACAVLMGQRRDWKAEQIWRKEISR
jgi:hypothetical protein